MAPQTDATTDELPEITGVDYPTRVGEDKREAVIIWFGNGTALRYVWDDESEEIEEQTYVDGVVHTSYNVGGSRDELEEYALLSAAEYINELREDPETCELDWPDLYEMLAGA